MNHACIAGTVRGEDSTGVFQIDLKGRSNVHKTPYPGFVFAQEKRTQKIFDKVGDSKATIGHHRAATKGFITQATSHPFEHSSKEKYLVGVHNGFIFNSDTKQDGIDFEVDSDWALYNIFKKGGSRAISEMNGAAVFVWWENDGKLRIYGNGERTFYWAYYYKENAMLMASEHQMLYWLASKNGILLEKDFRYPEKDTIYTFDPVNVRGYTEEKVAERPKVVTTTNPPQLILSGGNITSGPRGATSSLPRRTGAGYINNQPIEYGPAALSKFDMRPGLEVEFYPWAEKSSKFNPYVGPDRMMGEILVGGTHVDTMYAVIHDANKTVKENIQRFSEEKGVIKCRAIGTCRVWIDSILEPVIVVSAPFSMSTPDGEIAEQIKQLTLIEEDGDDDLSVAKYLGPRDIKFTKAEILRLTADGCVGCQQPILLHDLRTGSILWKNEDSGRHDPLCPICQLDQVMGHNSPSLSNIPSSRSLN